MPCRANHSARAATRSVSVRNDNGVHAGIPSTSVSNVTRGASMSAPCSASRSSTLPAPSSCPRPARPEGCPCPPICLLSVAASMRAVARGQRELRLNSRDDDHHGHHGRDGQDDGWPARRRGHRGGPRRGPACRWCPTRTGSTAATFWTHSGATDSGMSTPASSEIGWASALISVASKFSLGTTSARAYEIEV